MKYVFWVLGIILIMNGIIILFNGVNSHILAGFFCVALGAIVLPPIFDKLPLPKWTAYLAIVAGLAAFASTQPNENTMAAEVVKPVHNKPDSTAVADIVTPPEPENWQYIDEKNKMGDRIVQAIATASNQLQFEFPYAGGSTAQVVLSKKAGQVAVILAIDKGQFMTRIDGGDVRVKFDDHSASTYSTSIAGDGSTKYIFIDNTSRFIAGIRKAKTMVIESEFYQSGLQQMEFDVEGLKWK